LPGPLFSFCPRDPRRGERRSRQSRKVYEFATVFAEENRLRDAQVVRP
jgi:hypothetical protein